MHHFDGPAGFAAHMANVEDLVPALEAAADILRIDVVGEDSDQVSFQLADGSTETLPVSATIGVSNIGGVAIAITQGGPGAVFWMWVVAFLGASTAYVESALGQIYKAAGKAHIIGLRVSEMMPEPTTAPASVRANSLNSTPVRPPNQARWISLFLNISTDAP